MGGIIEIETDKWVAWTGSGEPEPDWSGLKVPNPTLIEPKWYRSTGVGSAAKAQVYRTQGLETKFSRSKDLIIFQRRLGDRLQKEGMGAITYLNSPANANIMLNVIT